ncbi:Snf5- protein 1 [Kappamyces sp. JEL0829]|nr:Snf5- protein 1 [Kappamyces sp. JEL0829]
MAGRTGSPMVAPAPGLAQQQLTPHMQQLLVQAQQRLLASTMGVGTPLHPSQHAVQNAMQNTMATPSPNPAFNPIQAALPQSMPLMMRQQQVAIQQLMQLKQAGKATQGHIHQLQTLLQAQQKLQHQHQQKVVQSGLQIPRPNTPSMPRLAQSVSKRRLGPPENTYAPRLKRGGTSLVLSTAPPPVPEGRAKRSRFVEEESEDSESEAQMTDSDEDSEVQASRRAAKRVEKVVVEAAKPKDWPKYAPRRKNRYLSTTKHQYDRIALHQHESLSGVKEVLVPITLDLELEGYKIQDSFTWNLNEQSITVEKFAEYMCDDLQLPHQHLVNSIARNIHGQLEDFKKYFMANDVPVAQDTRTIIRLDITVGKVQLRDRFEWDLASDMSPEVFASILASDLQLGGEFVTLIAHSIREQTHKIKASGDIDPTFAIEKPFRSEEEAKAWAPFVDCGENPDDQGDANGRGRGNRGYFLDEPSYSSMPFSGTAVSQQSNSGLAPEARATWRCSHCLCSFAQTMAVLNGPEGENTLCRSCGLYYEQTESLPEHRLELFK